MTKKTIALFLLVLIQFAACACAANNADNNADNNVAISDRPYITCEGDGETQELVLTYADGYTIRFSLPVKLVYSGLNEGENSRIAHGCSVAVYEDILAVFVPASPYHFSEQDSVLKISHDAGETWQDMVVPADGHDITGSAVGFTSQDDVWLLLEGELAATKACLRLYKSEDGGNTWTHEDIGQPVSGRQLDYIDFLSADEGYLAVGAGIFGPAPLLYKTVDYGETWIECTVETKVQNDYFCIDNIRYNGDILTMSGSLIKGGRVTLTSEDGLTWIQR